MLCDGLVYQRWKGFVDRLRKAAPLLTLDGDERVKTLQNARWIWKKFHQYHLDRGHGVGLIGGGSLLDLGGFCAATWKRGLPVIYIPTTLTAMIDAAIGGKTGINFRKGKNLIGVFAEPEAIWVYPDFLQSLPVRELRSGWVELFKHAVLAGGHLWEAIQPAKPTTPPAIELLQEGIQVKLRIVAEDPFERSGPRTLLNLGHTLGHVWEGLAKSRPLLHGEAVAIGLAQEFYLSKAQGLLSPAVFDGLLHWLETHGYLTPLPPFTWKAWEALLLQDKKILQGSLQIPLLKRVGEAVPHYVVSVAELKAAVQWYIQRYGRSD